MGIDVGGVLWMLFFLVLLVSWGLFLGRNRKAQEARLAERERQRRLHPERSKERSKNRIDWGEISYRLWVLFG